MTIIGIHKWPCNSLFLGSGRQLQRNTWNGVEIWELFPVMTDEATSSCQLKQPMLNSFVCETSFLLSSRRTRISLKSVSSSWKPRTGKETLALLYMLASMLPSGTRWRLKRGLSWPFTCVFKKKAVCTDCFWWERSFIKCRREVEPSAVTSSRVPKKTQTFRASVNKHNHSKLSVHFAAARQSVGGGASHLNPFNSSQAQKWERGKR